MKKFLWILSGLVIAGLISGYWYWYTLSGPQEIVVTSLRQLYSGEKNDMLKPLEQTDFSKQSAMKKQLKNELINLHSDIEKSPFKAMTVNQKEKVLKLEIMEILNNKSSQGDDVSFQMVDIEINQKYASQIVKLDKVQGVWKIDSRSLRQMIGKLGINKKNTSVPDNYGFGDAFVTGNVHELELKVHPVLYQKLMFFY